MNKFQEYDIKISQEEKKIVNDYLSEIKAFVKEKSLEDELYTDIENRLFEKLSEKENLNKVEIKKIIAELGEVEDIFADEISQEIKDETSSHKTYTIKEKYISFAILAFWAVVLVIIIGFTNTSSVFINILILLAIILLARWTMQYGNIPGAIKKDIRTYMGYFNILIKPKNISLAIIFGVILSVAGGIVPPNIGLFFFFFILSYYTISMLLKDGNNFVKTLFGLFGRIFRVVFFSGFGIFFLVGTLGLLALAGAYFTDFHYGGMQIFAHFPLYFPVGILFGAFALLIFTISFISYGLSKKGFGKTFLLFGIGSFFIAIFCAFSTGFDLYKKYSYSQEIQKTYEFNIKNTDEIYNLNFINLTSVPFKINYNFGYFKYIDLKKSKDDTLRITAKIEINAPKEDMKIFQENISSIVLKQEKNNLFFDFQDQKIFGNKTLPLFFGLSYLEVEIPENMVFESRPNYFLSQISIPQKYQKYEPYMNSNYCKEYFYEKERGVFSCNIDEKKLEEVKKNMKVLELYKNLTRLSPIKHKQKFKRNYYLELCYRGNERYCKENDWKLDYQSVVFGSGLVNFVYQDQSLQIKAEAKYSENDDGNIEFSDFTILNSYIKDHFHLKYYEKSGLQYLFTDRKNKEIGDKLKTVELFRNLGELSTIKHNDRFKRYYRNDLAQRYYAHEDWSRVSDWELDSMSVEFASGTVSFVYQDQSLQIKAQAKYSENNNDLSLDFSDFKILEIVRNEGVFSDKYYTKESLKHIFR